MQPEKQPDFNKPPLPSMPPVLPTPSSDLAPPPPSIKPLPEKKEKKKREGGIFSFFLTLIIAIVLVQLINFFLFQNYRVFGESMVPTLHDGDRLIISKFGKTKARLSGNKFIPRRGEVVVFVNPKDPKVQLIKRVIGLPGERVVVKEGKITVYNDGNKDGFNPDDADYGKDLPETSGNADVSVPEGHIFVSGDNRSGGHSLDSRNDLGTVHVDNIVGTLSLRLWPLKDARFF